MLKLKSGVLFCGVAIATISCLSLHAIADELQTYSIPKEVLYTHHNDDFTVRVRQLGGEWQDLYEYNVKVDLDDPQNASMVHFDMEQPVEISIKKNNGHVRNVEVRPKSASINPDLVNNTVRFKISKPANLSIEFDGDRLHNLHIFASHREKSLPNKDDPNVIWYGPGLHLPPEDSEGVFEIPSNKTVYIHGGAILRGKLLVNKSENVKILGRGIIDQPERGFEITDSKNVLIDGPIVINPKHYTVYCGQSIGITLQNLKTFSAGSWTDGIDLMSCSDVHIKKVFLRTSDDSIAIYTHRWNHYGNAKNISVSDSVLWADVAHPINIGLHGNDKNPELIQNVSFSNIDILAHDEDDRNYQGAMAITCGDDNLIKDVLFENIRIDGIEEGMLFNIRIVYNEKYSHSPGRGVENIKFRNVSVTDGDLNKSVIAGYDGGRSIKNVSFENVKIQGRRLKSSDFEVGPHVENVKIIP